jgi:hypothetical protein
LTKWLTFGASLRSSFFLSSPHEKAFFFLAFIKFLAPLIPSLKLYFSLTQSYLPLSRISRPAHKKGGKKRIAGEEFIKIKQPISPKFKRKKIEKEKGRER